MEATTLGLLTYPQTKAFKKYIYIYFNQAFCTRPLMCTTLNYAVNKLVFEVSENPVLHCPVITPARGHVTAAVPRDCTPHYKAGYKVAE